MVLRRLLIIVAFLCLMAAAIGFSAFGLDLGWLGLALFVGASLA